MPTLKEKYNHDEMTLDELEARAAADLYEMHERLRDTDAKVIGGLIYGYMCNLREAYRTAKQIVEP